MTSILPERVVSRLARLAIELPSWGFADTGTRFGKFLQDAAALTLDDKLDDAAQVHRVTGACPTVAIHVLWDVPEGGAAALASAAAVRGLRIGSVNPNVFQDQRYRFGSVANEDPAIRRHAIDHLLHSVRLAREVGSSTLVLWFADGTNYPGQGSFIARKRRFADALREVHAAMPESMRMLVEYKPFEPAFYHTDVADWGMAYVLARAAGPRARGRRQQQYYGQHGPLRLPVTVPVG
jgi:L-rhamnose isomerase/sugar isomerase